MVWKREKLQKYVSESWASRLLEIIADVIALLEDFQDLPADAPEEFFRQAAELQRQIPQVEQIQGLVPLLHRVVIDLLEILLGDVAARFKEVAHRLRNFLAQSRPPGIPWARQKCRTRSPPAR